MKPKLTKEQEEAKTIIKAIQKKKQQQPPVQKNILDWTPNELRSYILTQTSGLSPSKKMKFSKDLMERIKLEKEKSNQALLDIAGKNRRYYTKTDLMMVDAEIKRRKRLGKMRVDAGKQR
jgi:hypothetical protein